MDKLDGQKVSFFNESKGRFLTLSGLLLQESEYLTDNGKFIMEKDWSNKNNLIIKTCDYKKYLTMSSIGAVSFVENPYHSGVTFGLEELPRIGFYSIYNQQHHLNLSLNPENGIVEGSVPRTDDYSQIFEIRIVLPSTEKLFDIDGNRITSCKAYRIRLSDGTELGSSYNSNGDSIASIVPSNKGKVVRLVTDMRSPNTEDYEIHSEEKVYIKGYQLKNTKGDISLEKWLSLSKDRKELRWYRDEELEVHLGLIVKQIGKNRTLLHAKDSKNRVFGISRKDIEDVPNSLISDDKGKVGLECSFVEVGMPEKLL